MRPGSTPHTVHPLLPFPAGSGDEDRETISAGVSKDGALSWIIKESILEVIDVQTLQRQASWNFGATVCDKHTYISCVQEFNYGTTSKLLVAIGNASHHGMLCVLDANFSRVVKAIEIPHKVTAVEVITKVGGDDVPSWALNAQLKLFYGIVAVGTDAGIVYLIDMCLDDNGEVSDEMSPNKLQFISPRSRDISDRRKQAMSRGQHLCMVLDEEAQGNGYKYRRCDGTILKTFSTGEVMVSFLKYVPQIGSLIVGFSFGCFQIWKLQVPVLEYSSRLESDPVPITHIAYQEPENDPKNFSYIWTVHSTGEIQDDSLAWISLYQLAYNKKTWYSNYGAFLEDLQSVCLRFDMELLASPLNPGVQACTSSRIVNCYTLEDSCYKAPSKLGDEESFEETSHGPDLSLCVFVWECSDGINPGMTAHMAIFDMNRWYHAQMPSTVRKMTGNMDTCPYFSFMALDDVLDQADTDNLLTVQVGVDRLRRFKNLSPLPPEQYFYPSALAFETTVVTDLGIVRAQYLGTQRQVLATMQKVGPSMLLNPRELYNLCVYVGLLPRSLDLHSHNPSQTQMRDSLLSMSLDYNLLPFIVRCITEWTPGEYIHLGCTLKFILDWSWDRVAHTKNTVDNTCVTLYDFSGVGLDQRSLQVLHQSNQRLLHLKAILKMLMEQSAPTTDLGWDELQNKVCVINYIQQHLHMVLWFVTAGLLPELDDTEEVLPHQYSYPVGNLSHAYKVRRQELQKLHSKMNVTEVLMIDGLLEQSGESVKNLWDQGGGNGLYPPPSFHALLNIYLLEEPSLMTKHLIVLYVLLDLISLADASLQQKFADNIAKFTKTFAIPVSYVRQIQAFWLLDHKDFEESISVMLDPIVTEEIGSWQHCPIIKSYLFQDEAKLAIRYLNTVKPPLSTPEDVKLKLTVLLANRSVSEAVEYQRTCRDISNAQDLLYHLFLGCQQKKVMDQLLQLPLYEDEEEHLINFLIETSEYHSLELLVLHYLQRAQYAEAIQLNDRLKRMGMSETSAKGRERAAARNAIIDGFMSVLTGIQRKLIYESQHLPKRTTIKRREVRRPQPLSTTVTKTSHINVRTKSSLYVEVMDRVQDLTVEKEITPEKMADSSFRSGLDLSVNPLLNIGTPKAAYSKSQSQSQAVLYPSTSGNAPSIFMAGSPLHTGERRITSASGLSVLQTPKTWHKITNVEVLSMLRTPEIKRRTPPKAKKSLGAVPTPQSILKVRKLISASPSPVSQPASADNSLKLESDGLKDKPAIKPVHKKLVMNESMIPASPRSVSFAADTSVNSTPKKHLRFAAAESSTLATSQPSDFATADSDLGVESDATHKRRKSPPSPLTESIAKPVFHQPKVSPLQQGRQLLQEEEEMETESDNDVQQAADPTVKIDEDIEFNFTASHSVEDVESSDQNNSAMEECSPDSKGVQQVIGGVSRSPQEANTKTSPLAVMSGKPTPTYVRNPKSLSAFQRSPMVKLTKSSAKTAIQEQRAKDSTPEPQVSSTTDILDSPLIDANKTVQIDLTLDDDSDGEKEEVKNYQEPETSSSAYSFAPPSSTEVVHSAKDINKGVFKLRRKPQFTFSPPVQVSRVSRSESDSGSQAISDKKSGVKDKVPKSPKSTERMNLPLEDKTPRRSKRIYDSLAVPTTAVAVVTPVSVPFRASRAVYNSLAGGDSEIKLEMPKIPRGVLKSATRGLKSPPSADKLKQRPSKSGSTRKTSLEKEDLKDRGKSSMDSSGNFSERLKSPLSGNQSRRKTRSSISEDSPKQHSISPPPKTRIGRVTRTSFSEESSKQDLVSHTKESNLETSKKSPGRSRGRKHVTLDATSAVQEQNTSENLTHEIITRSKSRSLSPAHPITADHVSSESDTTNSERLPSSSPTEKVKRSPGRPKKVSHVAVPIKRSPGRPKKTAQGEEDVIARRTRGSSKSLSPARTSDDNSDATSNATKSPIHRGKTSDDYADTVSGITKSPGRRGKARTSDDNSDVKSSVKKSPSRRGRKSKVEEDMETDHSPEAVNTSQSRRKAREPMTPTRRSSRLHKEAVEEALLLSQTQTPTRKGRKKQESKEVLDTEVTSEEAGDKELLAQDEGVQANNREESDVDEPKEKIARQDLEDGVASLASPFHFSEPEEVETSGRDVEHFSPSKSFIFSPPLTRGLSKRLSVEPGDQTSLSRRLSLNPEAMTSITSRPAQRRLSHEPATLSQESILLPSPASPVIKVTPRQPLNRRRKETDTTELPSQGIHSRRGRQHRSQTPDTTTDMVTVTERAASEPPSKAVTRKRSTRRKQEDVIKLIPVPESPDNEEPSSSTRPVTRGTATSSKPVLNTRKRRVAKLY